MTQEIDSKRGDSVPFLSLPSDQLYFKHFEYLFLGDISLSFYCVLVTNGDSRNRFQHGWQCLFLIFTFERAVFFFKLEYLFLKHITLSFHCALVTNGDSRNQFQNGWQCPFPIFAFGRAFLKYIENLISMGSFLCYHDLPVANGNSRNRFQNGGR